jgi:hypothetical protein
MTDRSTTTEGLTPRLGIVGSAVLHAGVIVATLFGVAHKLDFIDQTPPTIPVDLVTVADQTNIAAETATQPMPVTKPVPQKPAPKKNEVQAFNDWLAGPHVNNAKPGTRNIQAVGAGTDLTADLRAILQSEIERCNSPPPGAPRAEDLIVTYWIYLNADGTVAQPPQLTADSAAAAARNPYTQAAANAARRAIYQCQPYKLPANRYKDWRQFTYHFDPRDLLGQ